MLKEDKTNNVICTATWPDFMPVALPICDNIAIIETRGLYSVKVKELGVYKYAEIMQMLKNYLKDELIKNTKFKIVDAETSENFADEMRDILKKIKPQKPKNFTAITSEDFVDI